MNNIINVKKKLGDFKLNVKLKLEDGINCFFGPSGSGKTSIINCIAGIKKAKESKRRLCLNGS